MRRGVKPNTPRANYGEFKSILPFVLSLNWRSHLLPIDLVPERQGLLAINFVDQLATEDKRGYCHAKILLSNFSIEIKLFALHLPYPHYLIFLLNQTLNKDSDIYVPLSVIPYPLTPSWVCTSISQACFWKCRLTWGRDLARYL